VGACVWTLLYYADKPSAGFIGIPRYHNN